MITNKKLNKTTRRIIALLIRDGNLCCLCNKKFQLSSGMKPSLEHMIPLSKGGKDTLDNLKLSHSSCNNKRGNCV